MKIFLKVLLLIVYMSCSISCNNNKANPKYLAIKSIIVNNPSHNPGLNKVDNEDSIFFVSKILNLGCYRKDTTIIFFYKFKNNFNKNVVIDTVIGSCGCLSFDYKKGNIRPKEQSSIKVDFETGSIQSFLKKEVFVSFKSGKTIKLSFYVNII